jgi:hypothetical protein
VLLDQGAQGIVPGVELREPGVLAPWPPADFVYSCSVSFSICFVLSSICSICFSIRSLFCLSRKIAISVSLVRCLISLIRCSYPGSRRQFSIDKNDRHRGSDAGYSPLLLDWEAAAGEGDVVTGRKQGDQTENQSANGLGKTKPVQTETVAAGPGALQLW